MIMIKIDHKIVARFEANDTEWSGEFTINNATLIQIEHYGKNYITDQVPDKFFELEKIWINEVDLKHHIHKFKQTAYLPTWDHEEPPETSLYLGHNGYLALEFTSPVDNWIKRLFNINNETMDGQQSTRQVLDQVKQYFSIN